MEGQEFCLSESLLYRLFSKHIDLQRCHVVDKPDNKMDIDG